MGLFQFVKDAGAKLFGFGASAPEPVKQQALQADALVTQVRGFAIPIEDLRVEVEGDTARVFGKVASQGDKERIVLMLGNVQGIAAVDDQIEVEKPEPPAVFYTVVPGDTLSKIAKQHYGNAMKYPVIFEANQPMLKHPDKIYPGQVLRIPALEPK